MSQSAWPVLRLAQERLAAIEVGGLHGGARAVLLEMCKLPHGAKHGLCWKSKKQLSDKTGLSISTVRRALRRLQRIGLIRALSNPHRQPPSGMSAVYLVLIGVDHSSEQTRRVLELAAMLLESGKIVPAATDIIPLEAQKRIAAAWDAQLELDLVESDSEPKRAEEVPEEVVDNVEQLPLALPSPEPSAAEIIDELRIVIEDADDPPPRLSRQQRRYLERKRA